MNFCNASIESATVEDLDVSSSSIVCASLLLSSPFWSASVLSEEVLSPYWTSTKRRTQVNLNIFLTSDGSWFLVRASPLPPCGGHDWS